jgi:hypothetical protein
MTPTHMLPRLLRSPIITDKCPCVFTWILRGNIISEYRNYAIDMIFHLMYNCYKINKHGDDDHKT